MTRKLTSDRDLPADLVDALWHGPADRLVTSSTPLQVKDRAVVVRYEHAQGHFVLKRHIWGGLSRTLRMMHRAPTARRCAQIGMFLSEQGIPTPRPRAHLEHCVGPFSYRSYLLTDYVEGMSLFQLVRWESLTADRVLHLARQVASIWQRLVTLNISHNDLKPENFIVDWSDRVWLIDMEKVRFHRDPAQLRLRHLEDARIYLHVRNWRDQLEAAELFRQELLTTSLGEWSSSCEKRDHPLFRKGYSPHELSSRISVAIVAAKGKSDRSAITRTTRSVRDMADEIVVVGPSTTNMQLQHPWVLVLRAGETATPDLVRELPEQIADQAECDAVRIPIEKFHFGRSTRPHGTPDLVSIRAFRQDRCPFFLRDGNLTVKVGSDRAVQSPRKIQDHVDDRFQRESGMLPISKAA
ncbi:MAG: lipopolysaccharide kinase InaA family protein [Aeoliella sp.]